MAELLDLFKIPKQKKGANYLYLIHVVRFIWKMNRTLTISTLITNVVSALFPVANLFVEFLKVIKTINQPS